MARTKKQTLENASERKRQIQEEILKETLAAKKKKNVSQTPSFINDFDHNIHLSREVVISSGSSGMENVEPETPTFPDGEPRSIKEILKPNAQEISRTGVTMNPTSNLSSSSCSQHFSGGEDLPKAVICIPDICKSPSKPVEEELTFRDSYLLNHGLRGKVLPTTADNISLEQNDSARPHSNQRSQKGPKQPGGAKKSPTCDVSASLRSLKAASEKVREEKSRKSKPQLLNSSPQRTGVSRAGATPGRRSPRHLSPVACSESNHQMSQTGSLKDHLSGNDDKPKINIFTDSMGVDLGKRIRSPRRLSDDMIALPIFSVRRWSNSPKEAHVGHGSKSFEENTFLDNSVSPSKVGNLNDVFKSPTSSPVSSRKSGSSPVVSPNISKKSGSYVSEKDATTLKSGETCNAQDFDTKIIKMEATCVLDSFLVNAVKQEKILESELSEDERVSKLYPFRKTKNSSPEIKSARKNGPKSDKIKTELEQRKSKIELLMSSDINDNSSILGTDQSSKKIVPIPTLNRLKIECPSSFSLDTSNMDKGTQNFTEKERCIDHKCESSSDSSSSVKSHPSLLCAMLVGGNEVAHTYAQDRVRYKPPGAEISDSDTDTSRASQHGVPLTSSCRHGNSEPDFCKIQPESPYLGAAKGQNNSKGENVIARSESFKNGNLTSKGSTELDHCDSEGSVSGESAKGVFSGKSISNKNKNLNIDLSSKLKLVNENVLKLLDVEAVGEFSPVQPENTCSSDNCIQLVKAESEEDEKITSGLYDLIDSLGRRLKDSKDTVPYSTPVDVELVQKLLKSCPKSKPNILKVDAAGKRDNFEKSSTENKMKEEEPGISQLNFSGNITENSTEIVKNTVEVTHSSSECVDQTATEKLTVKNNAASEVQSRKEETPSSSQTSLNTSSPSLNGSLCEIDLDLLTVTATNAINCVKSPSQESVCVQKQSGLTNQSEIDNSLKRTFQKSKTFDGNEAGFFLSHNQCGSLRRVNSSPQMNLKISTSPTLLNAGREAQVKSKLGSKIPVPGTSYNIRLSKKTWRLPRTIVEPKPLSILSELEEPSSQPKNVFVCPNLQKYLSVPSNRMIVPKDKRHEMQEIDAKAKEKEEARQIMLKERDEREKKVEDEINSEFSKFEPDFDEIDGILFMSFSNEIELKAHVRVEKTLEWDKDDTMLRISRAKAFEEAKAHNEDMGDFKLKHLRGQHMRWKKYRRLYSDEVKMLQEAKKKGIPIDILLPQKKTSDITKIKGWKKKIASTPETPSERVDNEYELDDDYFYLDDSPEDFKSILTEDFDISENTPSLKNNGASSRSKRRQGFSHQKAHRQLFRELRMDWEDRMIHRKLGGWSLKGNRPKAFSGAAKKRQQKKTKENIDDSLTPDTKDGTLDLNAGDAEHEMFLDIKDSFESPEDNDNDIKKLSDSIEEKDFSKMKHSCDIAKKKKMTKLIYPLLTERMAKNALKTLEVGFIGRSVRKKNKKERKSSSNIPALTLIALPKTPPVVSMGEDKLHTPLSSAGATVGSSPCSSFNTPQQTSQISLASTLSIPHEVEEPVMEGVEITTENISSPSIDSSSVKSCSKPGCRYGCICHLCSVGEVLAAPPPTSKVKPAALSCDKEYCRLGCICDSIDPEKPIPSSSHCGKTSCMLQCVCSETICHDSNDDIPYLPSMKRRPKPGERFSNLPQRERTHRASKNLDAITRKAMMLYETSEIYCEKVDRVKKKPDTNGSPTATPLVSPCPTTGLQAFQNGNIPLTNLSPNLSIEMEAESDDDSSHSVTPSSLFTANITQAGNINREQLQNNSKVAKPTFVLDDVRQTLPNMEPSAHKRKRKSHPLSNEIFSSSTCARTQPYKHPILPRDKKSKSSSVSIGTDMLMGSLTTTDNNTHENGSDQPETKGFQPISVDDEPQETLPKITSVKTLAQNDLTASQWEDMAAESSKSNPQAPEHGTLAGSGTKSLNPPRHKPAQADVSDKCCGYFGQARQHYGWHTSMVCLKAKSTPCPQNSEDDVQEEDEVKLLEFAANCNWEGAKKEILGKVAQCLTRGQYPQPRTMNVCEFVVEILPKAHQPSLIPPELRSKLPVQMYSIRVRITRRDHMKKEQVDVPPQVIDLSESSPSKAKRVKQTSGALQRKLSEQLNPTSAHQITAAVSTSPDQASSTCVGISGLSNLCISSQKSSCVLVKGEPHLKPNSVPIYRRSSVDSAQLLCPDDSPSASFASQTLNAVRRRGSFMQLRVGGASAMGVGENSSKSPSGVVTQVLVSPKDVKYVKIPGKDRVVEVIVGPSENQLIRLANKEIKVKPGHQVKGSVCGSKNFTAQSLLKAQSKPMESHLLGPLKKQEPHQGTSDFKNRSLIPPNIIYPHNNVLQSCTVKSIPNRTPNSNDEMIMVFDAAHIKALQNSKNQTEQIINPSIKSSSSAEKASYNAGSQTSRHQDQIHITDISYLKTSFNSKPSLGNEVSSDKISVAPSSLLSQFPIEVDADTSKLPSLEGNGLNVESKTGKDAISDDKACSKHCADECGANTPSVDTSPYDKVQASSLKLNERDDCIIAPIPSKTSKAVSKAFGPTCLPLSLIAANQTSDFVPGGSKRNASSLGDLSQHYKRPRVSAQSSLIIDEDSNVSACSISDLHIAAASPVGLVDRPKSVLSTSISTASTDDFLIMLSSEEDVDVGDNDIPATVQTKEEKTEKALENDHVSLYAKENKLMAEQQMSGKAHRKTRDKNLVRLEHHNKLERMRRSKLRALFDDLQQQVLIECGYSEDHSMSKANVLIEAKKVILKLIKAVRKGDAEIKTYEKANKTLQEKLTSLKINKGKTSESLKNFIKIEKSVQDLTKSVATDTKSDAERQSATSSLTECCHELQKTTGTQSHTESCHGHDTIDLLSPSTDEDKLSDDVAGIHEEKIGPDGHQPHDTEPLTCANDIIYEDISDPDEG